ncbi:MAG: hypothetical protein ACK47B_19850 [Armatimonadota bacterium]
MSGLNRRELLRLGLGGAPLGVSRAATAGEQRPRIAAVVTEYRENSHADVIVTKFLEGCAVLNTRFDPRVRIASLYLDQVPPNDLGREIAARHGVPVYDSIRKAMTLGGDRLAVDGVLLIGEHGRYPYNELGQHLYPRKRFFDEAVAVIREAGRPVPVFNDKHLSYSWVEAKSMYDTARALKIPFMAGSSLPVTWRKPEVELPAGTRVPEALVVAYGPVEAYGFHALETLQCMLERRRGGETGVRRVRCLSGEAVWKAGVPQELVAAALSRSEKAEVRAATWDRVQSRVMEPDLFELEYRDGTRGRVLMLPGLVEEFLFAARVEGRAEPLSSLFWLQDGKPFGHFARLSDAIQRMFLTGQPTYPVERTLLTTGVLDRVMQSRHRKGEPLETPELGLTYRPAAR